MPKIGDPLTLRLQLFDDDETKFVKATVTDAAGSPLTGSPSDVPHESGGMYKDSSTYVMPATSFVTVRYQVFDDAAFTTPSEAHGSTEDTFVIEILDPELIALLDELKGLLNDILSQGINPTIRGQVLAAETVRGQIQNLLERTHGTIKADSSIVGFAADAKTAIGTIDEDDLIEGET